MRKLLLAASAALLMGVGTAQAETNLSIATGGIGGTYYPLGGGLAELISNNIGGYKAVAEVTGGSVENMGLIHRQDSDLAIALADSGITSLSDLAGKRVSVGAPGSGTEVNAKALLESNGMSFEDFDVRGLNFNESADALRDGDIDAGFWSVGPPTSSIVGLATTRDIARLTPENIERENAEAWSQARSVCAIRWRQRSLFGPVSSLTLIETSNNRQLCAQRRAPHVYMHPRHSTGGVSIPTHQPGVMGMISPITGFRLAVVLS